MSREIIVSTFHRSLEIQPFYPSGKARGGGGHTGNVRLRLIGIDLPSAIRVLDAESASEKKLRIMHVLCGCQVPRILFDK